MICPATSSPRTTPSRHGRTGRRSIASIRSTITGSRNSTTKFGCALACEIIGGANPQNSPPRIAAARERTSSRANSQYQANAVPNRPRVSTSTNVTVGPNSSVTGANGMLTPNMAVFAIMFTPSGWFCRTVPSGFSRCTSECAVTAKNHSHIVWSWPLFTR